MPLEKLLQYLFADLYKFKSKMMLFLIDQQFKQAVFQFSKGSILLVTSLYKPLLMKNKCKIASMIKKVSLSGDISITKGCFVTKFFQCPLLINTFILVVFLED